MNVLTARARKINPDGSLGDYVYGAYVFDGNRGAIVRYGTIKDADNGDIYIDDGELIEVRPDSLGHKTGKRDKHGEMIYEGMRVKYHGEIAVVKQEKSGRWILTIDGDEDWCDSLYDYPSDFLEIVKDGE